MLSIICHTGQRRPGSVVVAFCPGSEIILALAGVFRVTVGAVDRDDSSAVGRSSLQIIHRNYDGSVRDVGRRVDFSTFDRH